ncbi:hypothetical protein SB861_18720 [Paraburkholderia sp. SIMBA_049]
MAARIHSTIGRLVGIDGLARQLPRIKGERDQIRKIKDTRPSSTV